MTVWLEQFDGHRWAKAFSRACLWAALAVCAACARPALPARADESPETLAQYMDGLRRLGLYTLAEGYCLRKLAEPDLPSEGRMPLVLELSRTYAEHARQAPADQQAELWKRAEQVLQAELQRTRDPTDRLALQVQALLTTVARAQQLRWQWELTPWDAGLREKSQRLLAQAVPELKQREAEVLRQLALATKPGSPASGRQVRSLQSLLFHARRGLLQALLAQVALYEQGSPERTAALLEAERSARQLNTGVQTLEARAERELYLAAVYRLQRRYSDARRVLGNLDAQQRAVLADRLLAEKARLLLDQDQPTDAAELLLRRLQAGGALPGELSYLLVRALLAMQQLAQSRGDATTARQVEQQLAAVVEQAAGNGDAYWAARCRQLLDRLSASSQLGERLAPLVERAKAFYSLGELQAAAAAYEQAATEARREHRTNAAFDLGYTAASIWLKRGDYAAALRTLETLLTELPNHPQSAKAHFLKLLTLAQLVRLTQAGSASTAAGRGEPGANDSLQARYVAALEEHRRRFRGSPTYYDATWLLAAARESAGDYKQALSLYDQIPANHKRADDAHLGIARCYAKLIQQAEKQSRTAAEQWRASATSHLREILSKLPSPPNKLTVKQAELLVRLAELLLGSALPDYSQADQLLERALNSLQPVGSSKAEPQPLGGGTAASGSKAGSRSPAGNTERPERSDGSAKSPTAVEDDERSEVFRRAVQLRVVSLAARGRWQQAEQLLAQLPATPPDSLLRVLDGLSELGRSAAPSTQQRLGQLQLAASERLLAEQSRLSETQRRWLLRCRAQGFAATGRPERAVELYEQLLRAAPEDTSLLKTTAELCLQSNRPDVLARGKFYWQQLNARLTAGSPEWFEARYNLALTCYRLGDFQTCSKLLAVTRLLYGLPKDASLRQRFEQLESQSRKAAGPQRSRR